MTVTTDTPQLAYGEHGWLESISVPILTLFSRTTYINIKQHIGIPDFHLPFLVFHSSGLTPHETDEI